MSDVAQWFAGLTEGFGGVRLAWTWAFLEAILLPLPPEILLIPLALAAPHRAPALSVSAVLGSLSGGLVSFIIGWRWRDRALAALRRLPGVGHDRMEFARLMVPMWRARFIMLSPWLVLPYKITSMVSGSRHLSWWRYLAAGAVGRGTRLISLSLLVAAIGHGQHAVVQAHFVWAALATYAGIGGLVWCVRRLGLMWLERWRK